MMFPDELDIRLLKELRIDSRRSVRQLAKSLGESPSTVYNRVKRLESREVIKKWTICFDYDQLDLNTVAFISIALKSPTDSSSNQEHLRDMAKEISKIKGIYEVHLISGEFDLLVKVRSKSLKTIGQLVIEKLRAMPCVDKTLTNACFETILEEGETNL